jgi:hypothetical protein
MRAGHAANTTVTVTPRYGFTGTVTLSATVKGGSGLTTRFSPAAVPVNGSAARSTLTFSPKKGGRYVVTITAKHGPTVHAVQLGVVVNDFVMTATPATATVVRGESVRYTLRLTPQGGFNGPVKLSIKGLPASDRVAYSHNPAAASSAPVITITTSADDASGTIALIITGVSGSLRHSVTVRLTRR